MLITDKDFTERERAVLAPAFPQARMLLCQFHVVKYLNKHVHTLYSGRSTKRKRLRTRWVRSSTLTPRYSTGRTSGSSNISWKMRVSTSIQVLRAQLGRDHG